MRKLFTLILLLSAQTLMANDTIQPTKFTFKFGGRIDLEIYSDTYKSVESRNGLQYMFPAKPEYNSKGEDINYQPRLRLGVAPSRFNFTATATNVLGATVSGFIEVDFMGVSDNVFSTLRMRHAYINMEWRNRSLLLGQTSHLTMADEAATNTVTFGGGYSLYPLNRPVQVQFRQNLGKYSNITIAAAMFGGTIGNEQSYAMLPDLQIRYTGGNPSNFVYGVVAGVKSTKPRTLTADSLRTSQKVIALDAAIFARYTFGAGYAIRLYGIWGQDLSALSILGGYAPLYSERNEDDYGYAPTSAVSAFLDFESPVYNDKGWQWGVFAGWQQNLGSFREIDLTQASIPNMGANYYFRVAPRLYYHFKKHLTFGLEYMLSGAQWAKEMDAFYRPVATYDNTYNHRVTFLARFKF